MAQPVSVSNLLCDGNYAVSGDRDALKVCHSMRSAFCHHTHTYDVHDILLCFVSLYARLLVLLSHPDGLFPLHNFIKSTNKYTQVLQQKAPEFNARKVVPLAVAGAFHTDFMAGAVPTVYQLVLVVALCWRIGLNERRNTNRGFVLLPVILRSWRLLCQRSALNLPKFLLSAMWMLRHTLHPMRSNLFWLNR